MPHTLVVVRHAKSDWSVPVGDRDRPLATRGRKQAPPIAAFLAEAGLVPDLVVVSPAQRARQTWQLVADGLDDPPEVLIEPAAYTFDGAGLLGVMCGLPESAAVVALVGHNPAVEELVEHLTGQWVALPTSAVAAVDLPAAWAVVPASAGRLRWAGRPADGPRERP